MKKIYRVAFLFFLLVSLAMPVKTVAQDDLAAFLSAGEDASKLIEAYTQPMVKSVSYGMTSGWYTTAKAHKSLGFDLSVTVNASFIPSSENFFDPKKLNFKTTEYNGARDDGSPETTPFDSDRKAPTIFGPKDETEYTSTDPGTGETFVFRGPEGFDVKKEIGISAMPTPMIQLGIGIIKNTDIKLRFVPEQHLGGSTLKMFGVGVMHDIKQHFKGLKMKPFDLSVLVAYNSVSGSADLTNSDDTDFIPDSDNGVGEYKFDSWVFEAMLSKKLSVLTAYAGVGYSMVDTQLDVKGDYTVVSESDIEVQISDPVSIAFSNSSFRCTLGLRLKLGPVYFNGDYTFQKYNTLSVGFGFTVR
jgi:hypothetical protein